MSFFSFGWAAPDCNLAFEVVVGGKDGEETVAGAGLEDDWGRVCLNSKTRGEPSAALD